MERVTHSVNLTVGVCSENEWTAVWNDLNQLAQNFGRLQLPNVSLSSYILGAEDELVEKVHVALHGEDTPAEVVELMQYGSEDPVSVLNVAHADADEDLYYDEDTLHKVARALRNAGLDIDGVTSAIREMQNAGILFRERMPS